MGSELWTHVRPTLVALKRLMCLERPVGLRSLGTRSFVKLPRRLNGRKYIEIGENSCILSHSFVLAVSKYGEGSYSPCIRIGDGVYIGRYVYLAASDEITIADGCVLSEHVYITDLNHGFNPAGGPIMRQALESKGPVRIGPNSFLGYRAVVMPGVTLGEWCIVGANSVVTRSFPSYSMVVGTPARLIKVYSHELRRWVEPHTLKSSGGLG